MDTTPPIKAHDAADLVRLLPLYFGFTPQDSLCAIATKGPRCRMGFSMRIDLPGARHRTAAAEMVVSQLRHQGADGAIVVAVSSDVVAAEAASRAVLEVLDAEDDVVPIVIAWADDRTVWSTIEPDGVPYEADSPHPGVLAAMVDGREIVARRQDLEARVLPVTGPRRAWFDAAWPDTLRHIETCCRGGEDPGGLIDRLERVLTHPTEASDGDALLAGAAVQALWVRDHVWERLTATERPVAEHAFWLRVARSVPAPLAAPPLCLAAIAAHRCGEGALMSIALDRAREVEPLYPLTGLLTTLIERGIGPDEMDRGMSRLTPDRQREIAETVPRPLDALREAMSRSRVPRPLTWLHASDRRVA